MTLDIIGPPATKGSGRAFTYRKRDGRVGVRVTADNVTLRQWETRVRAEANAARLVAGLPLIARPAGVHLVATFRLPRPLKLQTPRYQAGRGVTPPHTVKPDLDKLTRALGDALVGALYEDDAQLVTLTVGKRYAALGEPWGVALSVEIAVGEEKTHKRTIVKAHKIARTIAKRGGVDNPYAVGMAQAKKSAAKRKRARAKR